MEEKKEQVENVRKRSDIEETEGIKVSEEDSETKLRVEKQMADEINDKMQFIKFKTCKESDIIEDKMAK